MPTIASAASSGEPTCASTRGARGMNATSTPIPKSAPIIEALIAAPVAYRPSPRKARA